MRDRIERRAGVEGLEALIRRSSSPWLERLFAAEAAAAPCRAVENELYLAFGDKSVPLVVASAQPGEGRSTLAVLLAAEMASQNGGRPVLLVDADLNGGGAGRLLGVEDGGEGLAGYFAGAAGFDRVVRETALSNLDVGVAGAGARGRAAFSPAGFERFISEALTRYGRVIVDAPAARGNADLASLARVVGSVVLVVRYGGPNREQVRVVIDELARAGARLLGVVINQREYPVPQWLYGR